MGGERGGLTAAGFIRCSKCEDSGFIPRMTDPESLAAELEATGQYQVLRRLEPRIDWPPPADAEGDLRRAVVIDVETTGLEVARDAIIQFSAVAFAYDPRTGALVHRAPALTGFDDPGRPIPEMITRLTGITDADVAGQRLDQDAIAALLEPAVLVIAHNAGFDRPFLDQRLPAVFGDRHWACSVEDIPWKEYGFPSSKLEFLLFKRHRLFFDAHSAEADCQAVVHLLGEPFADGRTPLALLLERARRRPIRIWAVDSPIGQKDLLKARRYRFNFNADGGGHPKTWFREMTEGPEAEAEFAWLRETIYGGREGWVVERLDPRKRFARMPRGGEGRGGG